MDFVYKKVNNAKIARPIIPITVRNHKNDRQLKYYALVDSGSDECIFDAEVGEALGIEIKKGLKRSVHGVVEGKTQPYWIHTIEIIVGGWSYRISAGFMYKLARTGHGILGQAGFFDQFKSVKFEHKRGRIEVKPYE